jgi:hypothetical protein
MCEKEAEGVIIVETRRKKKREKARMGGWQWEGSHYIKFAQNVVSNVV